MKLIEKRLFARALLTMCVIVVITLSGAGAHAQQASEPSAPGGLPALPSGLVGHVGMGVFNTDVAQLPSSTPLDYRYQYLAGGVNTGEGWASWNSPAGQYAVTYVNDSRARGLTPAFIYYQILQSAPHNDEYQNLQDPAVMRTYYDDFKLLMQKIAEAGGSGRVLVDIEPDLNGTMQQHATNTNDDASLQPSSVASSGQPDVQGIQNTFKGYYQALAHIRNLYAPNVVLGLDVSNWAAGDDITISLRKDPNFNWQHHADRTAAYLNSFGPGFDLLFYSPLDRDAAYYQVKYGSGRWWDDHNVKEPTFDTMAAWLGRIVSDTQRRAMLWQVPNGNRVYRSENNTTGHWQDNRAEYFLNDANGRQHLSEWANEGVVGIMWGAGAGSQSHYYDAQNDGITNPAPINGNNEPATCPDDDGGYMRIHLSGYYSGGTVTLPGGQPVSQGRKGIYPCFLYGPKVH
jgi:hypothetical protein